MYINKKKRKSNQIILFFSVFYVASFVTFSLWLATRVAAKKGCH